MQGCRGGVDASAVPDIAAAIGTRIGIDQLSILPGFGNPDAIAVTGNRRQVAYAQDGGVSGRRLSQIHDHGIVGIVEVDPLKPAPIEVRFVQRRFRSVEMIQVANQALQAAVRFDVAEMPVQAGVMIPLFESLSCLDSRIVEASARALRQIVQHPFALSFDSITV